MTRAEFTAAFWALSEADRLLFLAGVQAHVRAERRAANPTLAAQRRASDAARQASKRARVRGLSVDGQRTDEPSASAASVGVTQMSEACPSTDNGRTNDGFRAVSVVGSPPKNPLSESEGEEILSGSETEILSLSIAASGARASAASVGVTQMSDDGQRTDEMPDWIRVGKAYAARWEAETDDTWMAHAANQRDLDAIASHCRATARKRQVAFAVVVDEVLDGAFADAWMRANRWPIRAIAKNPGKFRVLARGGLSAVAPHAAFGDPDAPVTDDEVEDVFKGRLGRANG